MMKYYLKNILNKLMKDYRIKNIEGFAKDSNRKVYIDGGEYEEYSLNLVFLIDTKDIFKKTITITIKTNSFTSKIQVIKHYNSKSVIFNRNPIKNIVDYVINEVINFKNQCQQSTIAVRY
jgi:hypothetical protein